MTLPFPKKVWGLLDTQDNVWLGDDDGPKTYTDFMTARLVAQMVDVQLGWEPGRTKAAEYIEGSKHLRDEVDTRMGAEEALRKMEGGLV